MDVYGALIDANGNNIQDMGITKTPFKIDTHLRTKLLMLLVIAAAVSLFIVGWVRVDVVAIAMMVLLFVLATLSCLFTMVISNVGACTLLVPLGISIAHRIGVDARVAAVVVGIGVSNSFILPTHQVNALYMGPGGYRTKDYIKTGGILAAIYIGTLVSMTYFFYM